MERLTVLRQEGRLFAGSRSHGARPDSVRKSSAVNRVFVRGLPYVLAALTVVLTTAVPAGVADAAAGPGTIVNFAGSPIGVSGNTGDGGAASSATLGLSGGVAVDSAGNVYIADYVNNRVRKVDPAGTITNFAGSPSGVSGNSGDGGQATSATLVAPVAVAVDSAGNVYITAGGRVRKVNTGGVITHFAGSPAGMSGNTGDGGPAIAATLNGPSGVAVDSAGNVYIADNANNRVRRVDTGGIITNFAGSPAGTSGNTGDGGAATSATLGFPYAVGVDSAGNVYIGDTAHNRVRKVDTGGIITNFAGSPAGMSGNTGDAGPATSATLSNPFGVAVDSAGNVYISDEFNHRVRRVDPGGTITDFAGSPAGTSGNTGDGGLASSATLDSPIGVAADSAGNVYIADWSYHRVREVRSGAPYFTSVATATFTVAVSASLTVTAAGFPAPTVTETGTLPSGVTFNNATATLSGAPAPGTEGSYPITFHAANGIGTAAAQNFTLTVNAATTTTTTATTTTTTTAAATTTTTAAATTTTTPATTTTTTPATTTTTAATTSTTTTTTAMVSGLAFTGGQSAISLAFAASLLIVVLSALELRRRANS
jgi:hypothetical protein